MNNNNNNNNNNCQFPTPCCRCQLFKAVNVSSSSSVSDLSSTPQQSQHLVVDPSKAPLSRFDLILLRSFQAAAAPAAAATASICSTTSSRQSSLVSTADQQQLLQSIELGEYCSLSCCSSSSVEDHRDGGGGGDELSGFLSSSRLCQKRGTIEEQITEEEGTDDGIDCGQDEEKKNRHQQAALSAAATPTATSSATTTAASNGHGQAAPELQRPVAKTTSSSTSSSGVSSSPNNGVSKISRVLVRRHSAFQLPQRFTAAATVAIGKLSSGTSPPPPPAMSTTTFHLFDNGHHAAASTGDDGGNSSIIDHRSIEQCGGGTVPHSALAFAAKLKHTHSTVNAEKIDDKANVQHISMQQLLASRDDGMELAFERCKAWSKYVSHLLQIVKLRLTTEEDYVNKLRRQSEQAKAQFAVCTQSTTAASIGQMPLFSVFDKLMDNTLQHTNQAECALGAMHQRVVLTLENRQKEHDQRRRKLKTEWTKQRKQLDACAEELRRAKQTHLNKDEHYLRAKELRQEQEFLPMPGTSPQFGANGGASGGGMAFLSSSGGSGSSKDQLMFRKRFKEMEKRRKAEEEALHRKSDAETDVKRLERELEERMIRIHSLRHHTVNELSDLIRQCELTTIAATSTLLKSLADLWEAVPGQFHRLADASRSSAPGADFLSFLQSLPSATDSYSSSCWHDCDDAVTAAGASVDQQQRQQHHRLNGIGTNCNTTIATTTTTTTTNSSNSISNNGTLSSSASSVPMASSSAATAAAAAAAVPPPPYPCRVQQRRNALSSADDAPPAKLMMTPPQHKRRGKAAEMTARLFDIQSSSSSSTPIQPSDAARSHRLARTRQVARCSQCGQLLIFDAVKCQCCGLLSHKKCLGSVQLWCGEKTAKRLTECGADRRMSIFGVPLSESLSAQHRKVPFILERCVAELERRGMRCKGLYRTCGVKSKVEWICVQFEQIPSSDVDIDLSDVHPMNIASVVKLYLRRLPEPLLTHELYMDWLRLDSLTDTSEQTLVHELRELVERLPDEAYTTLKFLILHLNRVSWFEADNLMSVSNLAAVIAPSLMWPSNYATHSAAISDAHRQSKAVEMLTRHVHEVFDVNLQLDWRTFFDTYPNVQEPADVVVDGGMNGDGGVEETGRGGGAATGTTSGCAAADSEEELVEDDEDEDEEGDELLEDDEEEDEELLMAASGAVVVVERGGQCGQNGNGPMPAEEKKHSIDKRLLVESCSSSDLECGSSAASTHHQQLFRAHHPLQLPDTNNTLMSSTSSSGRPPTAPSAPQSPLMSGARGSLPIAPGTAPQQRRVPKAGATAASNNAVGGGGNGKKFGERSYTTSILVSPLLRGMKETTTPADNGGGTFKKAAHRAPKLGLTHRHKSLEEMANCRVNNGTTTKLGTPPQQQQQQKQKQQLFRAFTGGAHNMAPAHPKLSQTDVNHRHHMLLSGEVTVQLQKDQQNFLANAEKKRPSCFTSAFLGSNDNDVSYV